LEFTPVRDFLSLDDPRATFEIFDNETIDEHNESGGDSSSVDQFPLDLAGTEKDTAKITDFNLLKVIGKGSFGKVSSCFNGKKATTTKLRGLFTEGVLVCITFYYIILKSLGCLGGILALVPVLRQVEFL